MIKAIIFDCFGVLTTDKWKEFVATLPEEQKRPAREIIHPYDSGQISEAEFIKQVEKLTGQSPGSVENLSSDQIKKNTQLLAYIGELKSLYKIGLLSNIATNWVRDTFLTQDERTLFDNMVFSHDVQMTKPDPRIFELACKRLEVEPIEAVIVDDVIHYCEAARSIGMQAVVYLNFAQMKQDLEALLTNSQN